jgi:hypothetical protein
MDQGLERQLAEAAGRAHARIAAIERARLH